MDERKQKIPTLFPLLLPSISYSTESPGIAQITHKKKPRTLQSCGKVSGEAQPMTKPLANLPW